MKELYEIGEEPLSEYQPRVELGEIEEIPKLLETYNELELGRGILLVSKDAITNIESQKIGGYILPTSNELEHLIIMRSGEIYIVQPKSNTPDDISSYKNFHNQSPLPYHFGTDSRFLDKEVEELIFYEDTGRFPNKISLSNKNGPSGELNQKIGDAVNTGFHLRNQRFEGKEDSRKALLKKGVNGPNFTPIMQIEQTFSSPSSTEEVILFDPYSEICISV